MTVEEIIDSFPDEKLKKLLKMFMMLLTKRSYDWSLLNFYNCIEEA